MCILLYVCSQRVQSLKDHACGTKLIESLCQFWKTDLPEFLHGVESKAYLLGFAFFTTHICFLNTDSVVGYTHVPTKVIVMTMCPIDKALNRTDTKTSP